MVDPTHTLPETSAPPAALASTVRELMRLALPLSLVQVGYHMTGFVDTVLAGRVSDLVLGATGLGSAIFFTAAVLGMGIAMGLDAVAAQAFGSRRPDLARRALWQGGYAALLTSVPLSLLLVAVLVALERFGIAPELAHETRTYVYARLPSLFPVLLGVSLRSYLQALRSARPILWAVVVTNVVNLVGDWLLLFGDEGLVQLGLPAVGLRSYGVAGLGWASTLAAIGQTWMLLVAVRALDWPRGAPMPRPHGPTLWALFRVGIPIGLQLLAEVGIFALTGVLMGGMGTAIMAAHQVALQLASMTFSVCLGIGAATAVQVGRAVGAGDVLATRRAGLAGVLLGASFMTVSAVILWLVPHELAQLMSADANVWPMAAVLIRIAGVFQLADGIQAVASGALRGAGITRWSLAAHLVSHWAVALPVALGLAFGAGMGAVGLWWGLCAGLASVAAALLIKFVHVSRRPIARIDLGR